MHVLSACQYVTRLHFYNSIYTSISKHGITRYVQRPSKSIILELQGRRLKTLKRAKLERIDERIDRADEAQESYDYYETYDYYKILNRKGA